MKEDREKTWLSEEGIRISEHTLLELYKVQSEAQISHLDSHYKYRNYYTTILSALLTIFVGGMFQFYKEPFALTLPVLLIFIVILSELGKRTIDRYYKRFLESVTILAKTENALGLDTGIKVDSKPTHVLWPSDKQIIPDRWISDRVQAPSGKKYESSQEFISDRMKMGDNRIAHRTFRSFQIVSII